MPKPPAQTVVATRRGRLKKWIDDNFYGSQVAFINDCALRDHHINQGELSGLLKEKSFGEKKARSLEGIAKMPAGYLDTPLDGAVIRPAQKLAKADMWTAEILRIVRSLKAGQKEGAVSTLRTYAKNLGAPIKARAKFVAHTLNSDSQEDQKSRPTGRKQQ